MEGGYTVYVEYVYICASLLTTFVTVHVCNIVFICNSLMPVL